MFANVSFKTILTFIIKSLRQKIEIIMGAKRCVVNGFRCFKASLKVSKNITENRGYGIERLICFTWQRACIHPRFFAKQAKLYYLRF